MSDLLNALKDPQFWKDYAQGLNDAVMRGGAAAVGGGVDLAAMALRPLGYNVEKPVGGSEWIGQKMQNAGIVGTARNPTAEMLASVLLPMAASKQGAAAIGQRITKTVENAMAPRTLNPQTGAIVWHGSPHKFDKFDSSKIGTGEGAQAYGHGLYLAESDGVAKTYSGKLSSELKYAGRAMNRESGRNTKDSAAWALYLADGDKAAAKASGLAKPELIDALDPAKLQPGGQLYKVDLPDDQIAKMLDWDKPLSQQAPEVQSFINLAKTAPEKAGFSAVPQANGMVDIVAPTGEVLGRESADFAQEAMKIYADGFMQNIKTGADLVKRFGSPGTLNAQAVNANPMKSVGIPGIRYLDGGSRGAGGGTSNFVVFPGMEDFLTILERNGSPLGK